MPRAPRSGITPKVRWTVFARDGFRCRYCGDAPPNCVLVVDHVLAVVRGGDDRLDNLITACEACNQGKTDTYFIGLGEVQDYIELGDKVVSWLDAAWREAAGVDWSPEEWHLRRCASYAETYAAADQVVREFAARIRTGAIDWRQSRYDKIMGVFECYIHDVNRQSHPSQAELTDEEIRAAFWRHLPALMAD